MRLVVPVLLALVLLVTTPSSAGEQWVLWYRAYSGEIDDASGRPSMELRTRITVGVYPTTTDCVSAARQQVAMKAKEIRIGDEAETRTVQEIITARPSERVNPPGVQLAQQFTLQIKREYQLPTIKNKTRWAMMHDYACWPAGVTPS